MPLSGVESHKLKKFKRGPLDDVKYQISRLCLITGFRQKYFFMFLLYQCKTCDA